MDIVDALERLHKLREDGVISEEEFSKEKAKVLDQRNRTNLSAPADIEKFSREYEPPLTGGTKLIFAYIVISIAVSAGLYYYFKEEIGYLNAEGGQTLSSDDARSESMAETPASVTAKRESSDEYTAAEQNIISRWWEAEVSCRGSNDRTPADTQCAQRQRADEALNGAGLCYGRTNDGSAANYQIHRCRPGSFGYYEPQKRNVACVGYWGTFGANEKEAGLSLEVKSNGGYSVKYSDYSNSKGAWKDHPTKTDAAILTDGDRGDSFTLEKCESGQPEFTDNTYGQFSVLDKFSGDYWSEAERRGIPVSTDD